MSYGSDSYEYASPIVVAASQTADQATPGQPALVLRSPFGQEACEYAIQLLSFEGAGTLAVSAEVATPRYAATNDGGMRGYMMKATTGAIIPVEPCFTPLRNGQLYFSINMSVGGQLCTVHLLFRRKIAEHVAQFAPMFHSANPDDMDAVAAAHAQAVERGGAFPSTAGRKG